MGAPRGAPTNVVTARIFLSAGEPSGDAHGGRLILALRARLPGLTVDALGGPGIAAAGGQVLYPMDRYTVMGFAEVGPKLWAHARLLRELGRRFATRTYDLAILIDYPAFHLRVAEAARRHGVRVLYYIAPKVWAWGARRARRLRRAVDRLAVILPFEAEYFQRQGIAAEFVGHPLLDRSPCPTRAEARGLLGLEREERVLAVFPGSRRQEVDRIWPTFRDAARRLLADGACGRALVARVPGARYPGGEGLTFPERDPLLLLAAADAALAKSGTTTLEAALCDTPLVVGYRAHPLTAFLARRLLRTRWISLVNLIAESPVVVELLQEGLTVSRLTAEAGALLDPTDGRARAQREGLARVRARLGGPGAAARVARMAEELLA